MDNELIDRIRALIADIPNAVVETDADGNIVLGLNDDQCEYAFHLVDARNID